MSNSDPFSCAVLGDWTNDFSQCLFEWQGLESGILALVAAGAGVFFLNRQIKQQDHLHDSAKRSRFAVAKAKTPLAAIEISDHARLYLAQAQRLFPLVQARSRQTFEFHGPRFPAEAAKILDALVENSDDTVLIEEISSLYSEQQVLSARLAKVERPSEHTLTIIDYILQPIMMDAIAMNLLGFGRDGLAMRPLTWDDVQVRLKNLVTDKNIRDPVIEYILDKKERGRPVPLALRRHVER